MTSYCVYLYIQSMVNRSNGRLQEIDSSFKKSSNIYFNKIKATFSQAQFWMFKNVGHKTSTFVSWTKVHSDPSGPEIFIVLFFLSHCVLVHMEHLLWKDTFLVWQLGLLFMGWLMISQCGHVCGSVWLCMWVSFEWSVHKHIGSCVHVQLYFSHTSVRFWCKWDQAS